MAYKPNPGSLPPECEIWANVATDGVLARSRVGYRNVYVRLFGGYDSAKRGDPPWPSGGGRVPTNWRVSRTPHPYQIEEWELA
jgi:hypothetical protein